MKVSTLGTKRKRRAADALVVPFVQKNEKVSPSCSLKDILKLCSEPINEKDFLGKEGEVLPIYSSKQPEKRIVLIGLGDSSEGAVRRSYGALSKWCQSKKIRSLNVLVPEVNEQERMSELIYEGLLFGNYLFSAYKHENTQERLLDEVCLIGAPANALNRCERTQTVMESVDIVRELVSGNADDVTPSYLAEQARKVGRDCQTVKVTVLDSKQLEKEKMGLHLAVGRCAVNPPCLSLLEYQGNPQSDQVIALVGKGITYDTGGLNLKTSGMDAMKGDMAGAAAVLGVIRAAAKLKLKVNLIGAMPCAENAIGSKAYKPGNVYRSRSGKTVEIGNTDGEGRLVLADAFSFIQDHYRPSMIIDIATLTGGVVIALGEEISALFCNDDDLSARLIAAGAKADERLWRMPLYSPYFEMLKSKIADLSNAGPRKATSITAALFLQEFVPKGIPWAHLDIAGTAHPSEIKGYHTTSATGVGVRLLVEMLSCV